MRTQTGGRAMSLPLLIAVLLVVAAGLFGVSVALEHAGTDTHPATTTESAGHTETGEEGAESGSAPAERSETASSERVLGIAVESPATVTAVVVVSLLLAVLVWRYPRPPVLAVLALFAAGAAVFDVAEVARQLGAGRAAVGVLATLVTVLHVAVVATAGSLMRPRVRLSRP